MNNWDRKIDHWGLAGVVFLKNFYSEKKESEKEKEVQDAYEWFG